jgi:hypothetical protein
MGYSLTQGFYCLLWSPRFIAPLKRKVIPIINREIGMRAPGKLFKLIIKARPTQSTLSTIPMIYSLGIFFCFETGCIVIDFLKYPYIKA